MRVVGVEPLLEVTLKYGALHIVLPIWFTILHFILTYPNTLYISWFKTLYKLIIKKRNTVKPLTKSQYSHCVLLKIIQKYKIFNKIKIKPLKYRVIFL